MVQHAEKTPRENKQFFFRFFVIYSHVADEIKKSLAQPRQ